ncbi:hypothetical protein JD844_027664 [Phrynosoma platyrhinos]|uniref:CTCK domain-containing protein n=1 Tax=Phrynosoma platyrhinos TaxID=52577 RepID=A0ABQ7SGN1_PHRPL|nr:hypothetical protein JD844_027664 [Phrynosoma platyrhinos]
MTTHMVGTGRKEEEKTSGFIGSTSQTLQTKSFTKGASGTVGWNTGVPGNATEHVESLTKTTTAMVGHDKSSTGVSPSMHITSNAIKWNTGVTRRPTEHVVLRRSTEGRESATAQTDGHDKSYTAVSSRTRRSITASLVKQNTEYKKTTERTAVRSSTESKKVTTEFDKPYTEVPAGTTTDSSSNSVTWNKDVTKHLRVQSSTESTERVTRQAKQNTVGPWGTVVRFGEALKLKTDATTVSTTATTSAITTHMSSTGVSPSTSRSLINQNTEYKKTTERTAVRSSTESKKATTKFDKPYNEVPAGTTTDSSSNSVTWNKDVTKHLRVQSSTESTERVTRQAKQNTVGPWGTVVGVTKRNGGSESTANLSKTQKWMDKWRYSTGPLRERGSTVLVTTKDNGIPVTEYTEVYTGCPEIPEPTSCRFKSKYYKIGETFKDPDNPCLNYTCTNDGFTTEVEECIGQKWCQNVCVNHCRPVPMPIKIKINGCSETIMMAMCTGECPKSLIYGEVDRLLLNKCSCCQATGHVYRNIPIICRTGKVEVYTYKHVVSCSCQNCKSP